MSELPFELRKLPRSALTILRYLGSQPGNPPASVDTITQATGLSQRAFGKAIRRLVTNYYLDMVDTGVYTLSVNGREMARVLLEHARASQEKSRGEAPAAAYKRKLSVVLPRGVVKGRRFYMHAAVTAPPGVSPLPAPARLTLRVTAWGATVTRPEQELRVPPSGNGRPISFELVPQHAGAVRIQVKAFQNQSYASATPVGGMYFDISAAGPADATYRAFGAELTLR